MLLALVEHGPPEADDGRHPMARRVAGGLLTALCACGLTATFLLLGVAAASYLSSAF